MKKRPRTQPDQPTTVTGPQALIECFTHAYNDQRPHRSLPHRATPATIDGAFPKALPTGNRTADTHTRIRHDRIDDSGLITLHLTGRLHHIGIGRTHTRTHAIMLIHDSTSASSPPPPANSSAN
jgi:hypothetical protein